MVTVDFATFCYSGDGHRLHRPGHLQKMVDSNNYQFDTIYIAHQRCHPEQFDNSYFCDLVKAKIHIIVIEDIRAVLNDFTIPLSGQYISDIDQAHNWQYHVVNHLAVIQRTNADYIVFADNDCWMVDQPEDKSWVTKGIDILVNNPEVFIVSPNDGEPERTARRMSQQMFLARVNDFRWADFNQPGWDGNVNIPGGPMPEYWAMLEGRMELHCRATGQYRYVLGSEYRYWHFNRLREDGYFETDRSKY